MCGFYKYFCSGFLSVVHLSKESGTHHQHLFWTFTVTIALSWRTFLCCNQCSPLDPRNLFDFPTPLSLFYNLSSSHTKTKNQNQNLFPLFLLTILVRVSWHWIWWILFPEPGWRNN